VVVAVVAVVVASEDSDAIEGLTALLTSAGER
jgi:hypothetical protein